MASVLSSYVNKTILAGPIWLYIFQHSYLDFLEHGMFTVLPGTIHHNLIDTSIFIYH